ncbi:hypothetical protein RJT34_11755 [Clitoria ternatea]|uniref:Uncharacterized protein n=1 Tax=Clitoria ternatea TaxID=43366 RepID=A0AAN9PKC0_CLITE
MQDRCLEMPNHPTLNGSERAKCCYINFGQRFTNGGDEDRERTEAGGPVGVFLFLIIAEGFTGMVRKVDSDGLFKGLQIGDNDVHVSCLLVGEASLKTLKHGYSPVGQPSNSTSSSRKWCLNGLGRKLGDGKSIFFGHDQWLDPLALKEAYPRVPTKRCVALPGIGLNYTFYAANEESVYASQMSHVFALVRYGRVAVLCFGGYYFMVFGFLGFVRWYKKRRFLFSVWFASAWSLRKLRDEICFNNAIMDCCC